MIKIISSTHILVIDDDQFTRIAFKKLLSKQGFTVLEADNGASGVELYKKYHPPLVITDILMPEVEGLQTIRDILAENSDVRIIAISGGGSTQNMAFLAAAQQIGACRTIQKPVKPTELLNIIKDLLRK